MTTTAAAAARTFVRTARPADLPFLLDILNTEILSTTATWTTKPRKLGDMRSWMQERADTGVPVLVAEDPETGAVAGYASYGPFRNGEGYAATVEHSVYVHADHRGKGIAACLLAVLIDRARDAGMRLMIGGISSEADASLKLHAKMGFRRVGRIPGAGQKFGRSLDLVLMALPLVRDAESKSFH